MNHTRPLLVAIYDTTSGADRDMLAALLRRNGTSIFVESVHTAAACSAENGEMFHWVTVVYRTAI